MQALMPKSKTIQPHHFAPLDDEERQLAEDLEQGSYKSVSTAEFNKTAAMFRDAAEAYSVLNTTKPITLRLQQLDIVKVKAKAERSRLPYQTLLGVLIHKYANGEIELSI